MVVLLKLIINVLCGKDSTNRPCVYIIAPTVTTPVSAVTLYSDRYCEQKLYMCLRYF